MLRTLVALPLVAMLFAAASTEAAPRPDEKPTGPALIGQAKSLNDLLEMTKAIVKNVGGDALYKEFEKGFPPELDPQFLSGIDPKRPFGIYGVLKPKLEDCRAVILIPVKSEKDFIDMLERFAIKTVKGKEAGTFDVVVPPDFPIPVALRIFKEYAYVAIGGFDVLESKVILEPQHVINPKEKAAAYLSLRLDHVSPDTKKALLAVVAEQTDVLKEMIPQPELQSAFFSAQKLALRWLKMLFDEGKEITFRIDADTKTGELFADITVEGMAKSVLADTFAKRTPTKNAFASLIGKDSAIRLLITAPLFADEAKEVLAKLIDFGSKEAAAEAAREGLSAEWITLIKSAFKSLKATVESGEMDLAAAIRGPNKEGFYTAVGAVHCKEGAQLEKALKGAIQTLPERERKWFKFDAGTIGELSTHEIDLSSEAAEPLVKIFGKQQKAYFAFGKKAIYASYGPDGMKLLKEAIEAKPGPAPVFDNSADGKKFADIMKRLMPDNNANAIRPGWFESLSGGAMRVTVEGGDKLKIRVSYNISTMLMLGFGVYAAEAGAAQPPPVAAPAPPPPPPPPPAKK